MTDIHETFATWMIVDVICKSAVNLESQWIFTMKEWGKKI